VAVAVAVAVAAAAPAIDLACSPFTIAATMSAMSPEARTASTATWARALAGIPA
jgi:hypothetical protein